MTLKPAPKIAIVVIAAFSLFTAVKYAANHGLLPSNIGKVLTPKKYDLPPLEEAQIPNVKPVAYPSSQTASVHAPLIRMEVWEWNAQMGLLLANGGNNTTSGSLMEKHGVNLQITRQDDTNKMVEDLLACAREIHNGSTACSTGANAIIIMGDQSAEVAAQANPQLLKLGADYGLKIIGAVGYSRGEDACMAPQSLHDNPHSIAQTEMRTVSGSVLPAKGVLVAGSIHEGDWDICEKWAGDNGIPNNPDVTTFDPNAVNWFSEPDYNTAAADYVAGKCDDRKEVSQGKLTGKTVHVCINGVATWTPGDVTVADKRGGLVKLASSLEYRSMMPAVIIGPGHFFNQNRPEVTNLLQAAYEGADQVKAYDAALRKAAAISAKVYNDEGGNDDNGKPFSGGLYWYHYFKPLQKRDASGTMVSLGGSAVTNLADNLILFGFNGSNNNMAASYSIFRDINLQQYPQMYRADGPTPLPEAKDIIDRSYIRDIDDVIANGGSTGAAADTVNYAAVGSGNVVSKRSYSINFATGSAQPLPDGERVLAQLKDSIAITGLKVRIDGYTDNTGSAIVNTQLSQDRAAAVKGWLQQHARGNFPENRFSGVTGHGPNNPVGDNSTADGRATNRRVEVTLED